MGNVHQTRDHDECGICFEIKEVVRNKIYENKHANCTKIHPYCETCITSHIHYKIKDTNNPTILCPSPGCTEPLDPVSCSTFIPRPLFVAWTDLLAESFITRRGFQRSACPYLDCSEVVVDECTQWDGVKARGRDEACPRCTREFCFGCGAKWSQQHSKICGRIDDLFLKDAKSWGWVRCPNCKFFVERNGGCNQVHCRCGAIFAHPGVYEKYISIVELFFFIVLLLATFYKGIGFLWGNYYG